MSTLIKISHAWILGNFSAMFNAKWLECFLILLKQGIQESRLKGFLSCLFAEVVPGRGDEKLWFFKKLLSPSSCQNKCMDLPTRLLETAAYSEI